MHTHAVVRHPDKGLAAFFHFDNNAGGFGIQRIFHQFLNHRSRPLNNLTGSDFVGQVFR